MANEKKTLIEEMDVLTMGEVLLRGQVTKAQLCIPKYQRSYAWGIDEVRDFIRDIRRLYDRRRTDEDASTTHFFGGIVVYELMQKGQVPRIIHEVIDGQQRLITFLLLLSILKDEFRELARQFADQHEVALAEQAENQNKAIEVAFEYHAQNHLGKRELVKTFLPSESDLEVWTKVIDGTAKRDDLTADSHRLLNRERRRLRRELVEKDVKANKTAEEYFVSLSILLQSILEDCQVIFIVCPSMDDAYELFQVLNDRGKSLSDGDLLRAHTLQKAHDLEKAGSVHENKLIDELSICWNEILSKSNSRVKHFLEQYYRIRTGKTPPNKKLYREYQDELISKLSSKEELLKFMKHMRAAFRIFIDIVEDGRWPFKQSHNQVEDYHKHRFALLIKFLALKNVSLLIAGAMALDQKEYTSIVFLTEVFFYRYKTICDGGADKVGDILGKWANRTFAGAFNIGQFAAELADLIEEDADDLLFKETLRNTLIYDEKTANINQKIRYFLIFLEDRKRIFKKNETKRDELCVQPATSPIFPIEKSNSVEHIFPQKPKDIDPNVVKEVVEHPERGNLTNTLGNLTFLEKHANSDLGNLPYNKKREEYRSDGAWLNNEIAAKYPAWGAREILEREEQLLDMAVKAFRIK